MHVSSMPEPSTVAIAMTGASGAQYGLALLHQLVVLKKNVWLMVSKAAQLVIAMEVPDFQLPAKTTQMEAYLTESMRAQPGQIRVFAKEQWTAPVASGSGESVPLVICPCSTGSLSAIATGASNNLIERAADVALKERRALILVPRESPYSEIHLQHMLSLTKMGAVVLPASPGFYNQPQSVDDLVNFIVARILNQLGISNQLQPKWGQIAD